MIANLINNGPINGEHLVVKEQIEACKQYKNMLIKEVAKKSLIELAISLAFSGIACFFVATPMGMATLLICAVTAAALNAIFRSVGACCKYRIFQLKNDPSEEAQKEKAYYQKILKFFQYIAPLTFSGLVDTNTRDLLIHEGGHALAANILIKNPNTHITVYPLKGGQTSYRMGALSKIGEFFGRAKSKLIIAAAGPALAVVTATIGFGTSLAISKSNPELSRYMKVAAITSIANHVLYALSALWTSVTQKGHDFIQLWAGGIHPIVSAISIIALPIIVGIGFFIHDKIKENKTTTPVVVKV